MRLNIGCMTIQHRHPRYYDQIFHFIASRNAQALGIAGYACCFGKSRDEVHDSLTGVAISSPGGECSWSVYAALSSANAAGYRGCAH